MLIGLFSVHFFVNFLFGSVW